MMGSTFPPTHPDPITDFLMCHICICISSVGDEEALLMAHSSCALATKAGRGPLEDRSLTCTPSPHALHKIACSFALPLPSVSLRQMSSCAPARRALSSAALHQTQSPPSPTPSCCLPR
eukprot:GGOE01056728.1.p2 GENE.GGOE01056728.1~~GGOE01056728.1.p2  ORF type:complete len:119 (+),score=14.88 GGOE01056728.1:86-442(+)